MRELAYSLCIQISVLLTLVSSRYFLTLTNFIEKHNNIYDIKLVSVEYIITLYRGTLQLCGVSRCTAEQKKWWQFKLPTNVDTLDILYCTRKLSVCIAMGRQTKTLVMEGHKVSSHWYSPRPIESERKWLWQSILCREVLPPLGAWSMGTRRKRMCDRGMPSRRWFSWSLDLLRVMTKQQARRFVAKHEKILLENPRCLGSKFSKKLCLVCM